MMKRTISAIAAVACMLAGCAAPTHRLEEGAASAPSRFQGAEASSSNNIPHQWWRLYGDDTLNALVETTLRDNPHLLIVHARLVAARAQVQATDADRLPQVNANTTAAYSRTSANTTFGNALGKQSIKGNQFSIGGNLVWELDLWKRVANAVEAANAKVQMAQIEIDAYKLILCSEVVTYYWQLRSAEAEFNILSDIRTMRAETASLLDSRYRSGLVGELDITKARVELANAEAEMEEAHRRRTLAEHGLATLTGRPIAEFSVAPAVSVHQLPAPPAIAPGLPVEILARRPDMATSTQVIRALFAQQKIAEAAFYPSLRLTGDFGFASKSLSDLLENSSRQYSLGPIAISLPILDGGRNRANLAAANAHYDEAIADHKGKLLIALREVDDALTDLQSHEQQVRIRQQSLDAAKRAVLVARTRYEKGATNFLDVADAERSELAVERGALQSRTQALLASVQLVRALGGGWNAGEGMPAQ